ncbi:HEPN domain-containing protein [Paraburkholderia youngii]|uniref:HEPN domain-containing protein n=1 Tax=Paraburkholderia youngii TaxID=2782701 RepID=UPI003D24C4B6
MSDLPEIRGSVSATLGDAVSLPPSDGESFVIVAREFWHSAHALADHGSAHSRSCTLLAAQALEEALKALLWTKGKATHALKQAPFGHNLGALWREAAGSGIDLPASPPEWCLELDRLHAVPFVLRYPSAHNGLVTPNTRQALADVDQVLSRAEDAVKSSTWRDPRA